MRTFGHLIRELSLDTKAVLDVGSSEGEYLKRFGPGSMGVTIISEHVAAAQARGLAVVEGNVENPDFSLPQTFEVVWANNLFEHMNAPHLFLMKTRALLRAEGGVLVLGVPVLPWPLWLTRFKKFRGAYAVSHVNFFTRKTLIETVRAAGWRVHQARAFYFKNRALDTCLNSIAPHIYVVAHPTPGFTYPDKRLRSLKGYDK